MNTDQWFKLIPIITTIVLGASTLWLSIRQYLDGNKNSRREEYKFAKLFFDDLKENPEMHAFPRKKVFQAIGRDQNLPPSVIEHLMTLRDPVTALSDYEFSRSYLKNSDELGRRQLDFASKVFFATETRRNTISAAYLFLALVFYLFAFSPWLLLSAGKISTTLALNLLIISLPIGISATVVFLREVMQLRRAMRLVKAQNHQADDIESTLNSSEQ